MMRKYDLVVIGTGTAASAVAYKCHAAGWEVAGVDSRPFGGTCALRGCDPKKVLVGTAELIDWNDCMRAHEVISGRPQIAWPALIRFKKLSRTLFPRTERKDSLTRESPLFTAAQGSSIKPLFRCAITLSLLGTWSSQPEQGQPPSTPRAKST
jgi:glutathione reductase (NADPH)